MTHPRAGYWNSLDNIKTQTPILFIPYIVISKGMKTQFPHTDLKICKTKIQVLYLLKNIHV